MQAESNPVDDETDEGEDNNNRNSRGPSNADAFSALETAMEWPPQSGEGVYLGGVGDVRREYLLLETKLKEHAKLKIKGYNIIRSDRQEGGGGGLAFLVRDINYRTIDNPQFTDSKLEIQRLNVIWKGKNLNISNMYHPPNQKSLPDNLLDISESNLLVGDLNAKHSSWGSVINNREV
ncbi:uncharacterized protein TNCV_3232811 [Trichonephila clavipes]|nr:uncharacterized protein TNCV_3232811 [Trichonephila clavipes]